jgi:hypothetical protein
MLTLYRALLKANSYHKIDPKGAGAPKDWSKIVRFSGVFENQKGSTRFILLRVHTLATWMRENAPFRFEVYIKASNKSIQLLQTAHLTWKLIPVQQRPKS